jgi:hypothetical protein
VSGKISIADIMKAWTTGGDLELKFDLQLHGMDNQDVEELMALINAVKEKEAKEFEDMKRKTKMR